MKEKEDKLKKNKKKKERAWVWPVKIFIIALILSFAFSFMSEFIFSKVGIVVSLLVVFCLLAIGVITDMIGIAVTSADISPFTAMMSRKVKGAKQAMKLIKNAEKVSSICNDVAGDICGILTGAAGAVIALKLMSGDVSNIAKVLIASSVSAAIAGLTILGKASFKKIAMDNSTKIVLIVGKILSIFSRDKKSKKKEQREKKVAEKRSKQEVLTEEMLSQGELDISREELNLTQEGIGSSQEDVIIPKEGE